jgi:hypothetical protein
MLMNQLPTQNFQSYSPDALHFPSKAGSLTLLANKLTEKLASQLQINHDESCDLYQAIQASHC